MAEKQSLEKPCPVCSALGTHMYADFDSDMSFPKEFVSLTDVRRFGEDDYLRQCPACGAYYKCHWETDNDIICPTHTGEYTRISKDEADQMLLHDDMSNKIYGSHYLWFRDIVHTFPGLPKDFVEEIKSSNCEPVVDGAMIKPFTLSLKETHYFFNKSSALDTKHEEKIKQLHLPKIVARRTVARVARPVHHFYVISTIDKEGLINIDTVFNIVITDKKYHLNYALAFLNSKFCAWFMNSFLFGKAVKVTRVNDYCINSMPIFPASIKQQAPIIQLVDKMFDLVQKFMNRAQSIKNNDEQSKLEADIVKTENEMNSQIYGLYKFDEEERAVIENAVGIKSIILQLLSRQ
nr:TaqI-like C-terminal specificity domain-containing protein [Candidatus Sigynarchaeota archaeon]